MSDELRRPDEKRFSSTSRHLTPEEAEFLRAILRNGEGGNEKLFRLDDLTVIEMNDGGMGSLFFESARIVGRKLGRSLVEAEFFDRDGVLVSTVVNLDDQGDLFELDVWKVDFSPLLGFPKVQDITMKRPSHSTSRGA